MNVFRTMRTDPPGQRRAPDGVSHSSRLAVCTAVLLLALLVGYWSIGPRHSTGDTLIVVRGTEAIRTCVETGKFTSCGRSSAELRAVGLPRPYETAVGPYPLFQYIPAGLLIAFHTPEGSALRALSALNAVAFLAMLAVLWFVAVRTGNPAWGPGLALAAVAGPLLFYANSTFGEMLAAFLIVLFAAAVLLMSRPSAIVVLTWFAGITKETAPPFLLALGVTATLARGAHNRSPRAQLAALVLGTAAALGTNAAFNVFRYGTPKNLDYLNGPVISQLGDVGSVPLMQRFKYLGALLFAPNGGLAEFWPVAAALIAAAGVIAVRSWRRREARAHWLPPAALVATFLALSGSLASWYQPFGWFAWCPRLTIPWVPGILLLGVVLCSTEASRLAWWLTRSRRSLLLVSVLVWASALPHIGFLWHRSVFTQFFASTPTCPFSAPRGFHGHTYFRCIDHLAWHEDPPLIRALRGLLTWPGALFAGAFVVGTLGLLTLMRDSLDSVQAGTGTRQTA